MSYYRVVYDYDNGSCTTSGSRIVRAISPSMALIIASTKISGIRRFIDVQTVNIEEVKKIKALNEANNKILGLHSDWFIEIIE